MYLGITPVIMEDVSPVTMKDTENCVDMLKRTGDTGWAIRK